MKELKTKYVYNSDKMSFHLWEDIAPPICEIIEQEEVCTDQPLPSGYVPLSESEHTALFEALANGKILQTNTKNGKPEAVDPAPPTLAESKATKLQSITTERDRREQAGFEYMGKIFDADATSIQRITLAAQSAGLALQANEPFEIIWTVQDDSTITLSATEMLGIVPAIAMHANTLHQEGRRLKELVGVAKTVKAVAAITWA